MIKVTQKRHLKRRIRRRALEKTALRSEQRKLIPERRSLFLVCALCSLLVSVLHQVSKSVSITIPSSRSMAIDGYFYESFSKRIDARDSTNTRNEHEDIVFYTKPLTADLNNTLPWVVFYNIFIPSDQGLAGVNRAKRIVSEQIGYIRRSYAVNARPNKTTTVFYNTIGDGAALTDDFMNGLCTGQMLSPGKSKPWAAIRCHHLAHYSKAFEEVTLERMHGFCTENPTISVSYIHSKGSYHDHEDKRNEYWRRHGTLAALNKNCVDPPTAGCNVCGLAFYTLWVPFFPGNFFTAKCSYVRKLLPPLEFGSRMEELAQKVFVLQSKGIFDMNLFPIRDDFYGLNRYSSEHWVGSHPSLEACDLSKDDDFGFWLTGNHWSKNFSFGMGPRHSGSPVKEEKFTIEKVQQNETLRLKEYFFLAGRIFKYFELYGEVPKPSSWVWTWFPDGAKWQSAVSKYGKSAVESTIRDHLGLAEETQA